MYVICCRKILIPHTLGTPKKGAAVRDFGCPACGKQFQMVVFSKEDYKRDHDKHQRPYVSAGLPVLEVPLSETIELSEFKS